MDFHIVFMDIKAHTEPFVKCEEYKHIKFSYLDDVIFEKEDSEKTQKFKKAIQTIAILNNGTGTNLEN